ncbi:MAG TPA: 5'-nucleotidase C-terminal domain-containing protein [Bacteroidia bacterium]|nr:5'-nucleotidase C-terminal domain-containing protein [Bacteroidia bacterium]
MKHNPIIYFLYILFIFNSYQCTHKHYCYNDNSIQKEHIVIQSQNTDSTFYKYILPYKTKIDNDLNVVIANNFQALEKNSTCNNLAQFVFESMCYTADSIFHLSKNYFVLINYGGLRSNVPAGNINKRNIYELMPFDNSIVILELNEQQTKELLDKTKNNYKLLLKSKNSEPTNILVTSDYLYQGGDDCAFLKSAKKLNTSNIFIRDAIIQYCIFKKEIKVNCFY